MVRENDNFVHSWDMFQRVVNERNDPYEVRRNLGARICSSLSSSGFLRRSEASRKFFLAQP